MTPSEQARAAHPCDACGGSGKQHPGVWHVSPYYGPCCCACPVCQGAGRISDVIPAADALADAETLRLFVFRDVGRARRRRRDLEAAQVGSLLDLYNSPSAAGTSMAECARAAFRAVPGLRGDR